MESTTAVDVSRELAVMFSRYGVPHAIKADNAPQLSGQCGDFKEFCQTHGVQIWNTIPYWPQSNGEVERQNRSILKRLKISQELGKDWRAELRKYLLTYHATRHPTTGKSPGELMFGRRMNTTLPTISIFSEDEAVREQDAVVKQKGKEYADHKRRAKDSGIEVNDHVLVKRMRKNNKLQTEFSNEEFIVRDKAGTDTLIESTVTGKKYSRSSAHLKKLNIEKPDSETQNLETLVPVESSTSLPSVGVDQSEKDTKVEDEITTNEELKEVKKRTRVPPTKFKDYVSFE
ncbi:uncharacterized protein K02A2.6-like [Uranotaenia lowii]|uniref:uncharacterized protein K02A2.6-like n=1 Tax=Uranotaenia lowii TaxID=190385 RepID=UPI00247A8604|nr:uncharacterized protein K02A2.6-like [Uranotaenia lowii]XP_055612933.1 uncharacterized protein K02A2.6-like [Uranotaenia lowii]